MLVFPDSFLNICKDKILFASFSGGADSTALVLALHQAEIPFTAVHFTHGIREEETGKKELDFCRTFCGERGIPFLHRNLDVPGSRKPGEGLEEAARRCRFSAWKTILPENCAVVTAHHGDDAAETLLLRLFRGGNVSALTGLRDINTVEGILFLRPLLAYSKQDLLAFLHEHKIRWMEDATNRESEYTRNFFRNRILPEIREKCSFADDALQASLRVLREDADFLEQTAAAAFRQGNPHDVSFWLSLHPALKVRVLRAFLSRETGNAVIPDPKMMNRFDSLLVSAGNRDCMPVTGTEYMLIRRKNGLVMQKHQAPPEALVWDYRKNREITFGDIVFTAQIMKKQEIQPDRMTAFFDLAQMPETLSISVRQEGDRMIPSGARTPQKVKKLLTDAHIPAERKNDFPLIRSGETIFWIAGIRRSALALCTAETEQILVLHYQPKRPFDLV